MVSALILQLLASDPNESYSALQPPALLEKRRFLMEEKPGLAAPFATMGGGIVLLGAGAALATAMAISSYGCAYGQEGACYTGGTIATVGLAAVTFGLVWLIHRLGARSSISARVEEINDLLDLKRAQPAEPAR
jgi:hypothetical protein